MLYRWGLTTLELLVSWGTIGAWMWLLQGLESMWLLCVTAAQWVGTCFFSACSNISVDLARFAVPSKSTRLLPFPQLPGRKHLMPIPALCDRELSNLQWPSSLPSTSFSIQEFWHTSEVRLVEISNLYFSVFTTHNKVCNNNNWVDDKILLYSFECLSKDSTPSEELVNKQGNRSPSKAHSWLLLKSICSCV